MNLLFHVCGTLLTVSGDEAVAQEEGAKHPCPVCTLQAVVMRLQGRIMVLEEQSAAATKRLNAFMRAQGYRDDKTHGPGACKHQDALEAGPDVPRRYGSFKSVHCLLCDSFRLTDGYGESMSHWMGREAFEDGLKDDDDE
jgi:hypothetical protein